VESNETLDSADMIHVQVADEGDMHLARLKTGSNKTFHRAVATINNPGLTFDDKQVCRLRTLGIGYWSSLGSQRDPCERMLRGQLRFRLRRPQASDQHRQS